jgi:hypothetical protein
VRARGVKGMNSTALELERKFEIVLLAENGRMEIKSSENKSKRSDLPPAPKFVMIRAKLRE